MHSHCRGSPLSPVTLLTSLLLLLHVVTPEDAMSCCKCLTGFLSPERSSLHPLHSLVVTLWDYEPNWLIVRLIVQTYVGIVLLSILSAPFSPPKKIIQNWLTNTYHGILKPYYDVSQMIYGIYASWICSSDSGLGFQSLGQVKGNGKCDPPLT